MHRGYVKLWRCVEDTGLIGQPSAFYLYTYLLLKATHKPKSFVIGGAVFDLQPGQIIVGRNKLAEDTGLSVRQIRTSLDMLKKLSLIATKTTNKCTVVSIVNWNTYQNSQPAPDQLIVQQIDQQTTSTRPAPDQHPTTIQEYKNIRTEELNTDVFSSISSEKDTSQTVPQGKILEIYREELPFLRQPRTVRPNVQVQVRARWNEKMKEGRFHDENGGLEYFRKYFRYVAQNGFLSGRKTSWKADYEWLFKAANFDKVTTGKYAEDDEK